MWRRIHLCRGLFGLLPQFFESWFLQFYSGDRSANYGLFFVNKVILEHCHAYLFASVAAFILQLQSKRQYGPQSWKYSLALYRKVCGPLHCSTDRHLRNLTNKANLVHHGWGSHTSGWGMMKNSAYKCKLVAKVNILQKELTNFLEEWFSRMRAGSILFRMTSCCIFSILNFEILITKVSVRILSDSMGLKIVKYC